MNPRLRQLLLVLAAGAAVAVAFAAAAQSTRDTQRKLDRAQKELKEVAAERRRIEGQRSEASRKLRAADEKLGASSRALRDTEAELDRQQQALEQLQQRRDAMASRLGAQRRELAALLRAAYAIGDAVPLKLLLAQDSVAEANRMLALHGYLQRDHAQRIAQLHTQLQELEQLQQQVTTRQHELAATSARQQRQLAQLQDDRKARAQTARKLEARYQDKRSREKALGSDVAGLKKLLAQLRAAAERAEAQRRAAAERARKQGGHPPPVIANAAPLRVGGLGWPLSGSLLAGYRGKLPDGSDSSGLLIAAPAGTTVKAVADGQVVFADWMNGYGLILIVDHGNGYMSLYARNEALLRNSGDSVRRGDPVASVGSSGGAGPPALYFELRRNGDPVDPAAWLKQR